jgi:hypothetical protein
VDALIKLVRNAGRAIALVAPLKIRVKSFQKYHNTDAILLLMGKNSAIPWTKPKKTACKIFICCTRFTLKLGWVLRTLIWYAVTEIRAHTALKSTNNRRFDRDISLITQLITRKKPLRV